MELANHYEHEGFSLRSSALTAIRITTPHKSLGWVITPVTADAATTAGLAR